ncbi:helix-turn-helix domain-containing protein [Luteolibacter luteus]|uniref:Helix-turn-helix domain-containing protein n=1 Tax=Luteolibacter luteus TaxID=2728835 RepID=A0A858RN36_9BACT|nr:helix-turn-helix domain-containing protein [Luteolibacter luteus]QJE98001.1 helix-turn-helix domain-containing protein [Luteolibacter luteus]
MAKTIKQQIERRAYSFEEVAAMLGKHRSWVYRQVAKGAITPITGFGAAMISAAEVNRITGCVSGQPETANVG